MKEAATIAHVFPAFGNPLDLPLDVFQGLQKRVFTVLLLCSGSEMTDRAVMEDMSIEPE